MKKIFFLFVILVTTTQGQQIVLFEKKVNTQAQSKPLALSDIEQKMSANSKFCYLPKGNLEQNFRLALFDEQSIDLTYRSKSVSGVGAVSYSYAIKDDKEGTVVFTVYNDTFFGTIFHGSGERFSIVQKDKEIAILSKINPDYFKNTCPQSFINKKTKKTEEAYKATHASVCTADPCPNSVVDVMVLFSNQALALAKTENNAIAQATNALQLCNEALVNSGVNNLTFNLVFSKAIDYDDDKSFKIDLEKLSNPKDGFLDKAHEWRDQYGADLVVLLVGSVRDNTAGLGNTNIDPTDFSSTAAFSVVDYTEGVASIVLSHEMGHNLGLRHDWFQYRNDVGNDKNLPCEHHHGYSNREAIRLGVLSAKKQRWRTIMAYGDECRNAGISCQSINRWSNPDRVYEGDPMGVAIGNPQAANEKFALERTGCIVADFRKKPESVVIKKPEEDGNLFIMPNPTKNKIMVSKQINSYKLFDVTGKLLAASAIPVKEIDLSKLATGMYYLTAETPEETKQFKVVKE